MFFIGPLADRHGRRPVMLGGWLITIVFGLLSCFSPNIWVLMITRLLVGVGIGWRYLTFFAALPTIIVTIAGYYLLKESPRWLISVGQIAQAETNILSIARINGLKHFRHKLKFTDNRISRLDSSDSDAETFRDGDDHEQERNSKRQSS
eukprot:gene33981-41911_t